MEEIKIAYTRGQTLYKTAYPKYQNKYKYAKGTPEKSLLGSGGFGSVYLVEKNQQLFAMKVFKKANPNDPKDAQKITTHGHKESDMIIEVQKSFVDDPFMQRSLPRLEEAFYDENNVFHQITDYIQGSSLKKCILDTKDLGDEKKKELIFILLYIIGKLHQKEYLHRDIKPGNVMIRHLKSICDLNKVDIWKNIVVIDFGFACKFDECDDETKGTVPYMSPELLLGRYIEYEQEKENGKALVWEKSDVWALVVLFYQVVFSTSGKSVLPFTSTKSERSEKRTDIHDQITQRTSKLAKSGNHTFDSIIYGVLINGIDVHVRPSISDMINLYGTDLTIENGNIYVLSVEEKNPMQTWFGFGSSFTYNINGTQWLKDEVTKTIPKPGFLLDSSLFKTYSFKICVQDQHPVYLTNNPIGEYNLRAADPNHKIYGFFKSSVKKSTEPISRGVVNLEINEVDQKEKLYVQCANHPQMGALFQIRNVNSKFSNTIGTKTKTMASTSPLPFSSSSSTPSKLDVVAKIDLLLDPSGDSYIVRIENNHVLWSRKRIGPICQNGHVYDKNELVDWVINDCRVGMNICKKCNFK